MGKRKMLWMVLGALIVIGSSMRVGGIRLSRMGAVCNILAEMSKEDIEVLERIDLLESREWIAYRNKNRSEYGSVLVKQSWGVFYHAESAVRLQLSDNEPVVRSKPSMYGKEMIFVATNNPEIAYISSGIEDTNFSQETIQALTLQEILLKPDYYRVQELKDGYTLFIWDESIEHEESSRNSYMLGFNKDGELIVDATGTMKGVYVQ